MKEQNGKNSKKWLLPVLILAALAVVVGIVLAVVLPGIGGQQGNQGHESNRPALYWNKDGASYIEAETGMSTREKQDDGMYHITMYLDGQEKDLRCADKQLINYMDTMTVLVLTLDENGDIIDAINAEEAVKKIADGFYVQRVDGNTLTINTSFAMNGMELPLEMGENCKVYNMDPRTEPFAQEVAPELMDQVAIYGLNETTPTHIFIKERAPQTGVYFRAARMYDTTTGQTTREPDENGVYTIQFAHNGQLVDVKCKDKALVTSIDAKSPLIGEVAPIFDEDGYLVDTVSVILALRGKLLAQDYHVVEVLENNTYKLERISSGTEQGKVITVTLDENCNIYNVCQYGGCCESLGQKENSLKLYDRLNMYGDLDGNPILIHITRRLVDVPVFWNLKRMYTSADGGSTTREPDAKGYYVFDMLQDGKPVTVRTKDKAIATAIDFPYDTTVGLALEGDIVTGVYKATEVIGSYSPGYRRYVTSITGNVAVLTNATDATISANVILTEDCKIYDVTGNPGVKKGTVTTLKEGDRVVAWYNYREQVSYVFVTDREITIREYCEYCKKKVKWEAAPKNGLSTIDTGKHLHYVLGEDVDVEWGYGVLTKGTTLCLNLYGSNIKHATRIFVAGGSKLNVMGKGTITATGIHKNDALKTGNITVADGEVNIYNGVTVKSANKNIPAVYVNGKNAVANLHGGKITGGVKINQGLVNLDGKTDAKGIYIGTKGKLNVKETWTGEATLQAAIFTLEGISKTYGTSEGAFTGEMTYDCEGDPKVIGEDGGLKVLGGIIPDENDPNYRMCVHCGQKVMWVEAPTTGHSTVDSGEHLHYYLTEDFVQNWGYLVLQNNTTICLDLNGHTVDQMGRILLGGGQLNIMGEGTVTTRENANATLNTGAITVNTGTVNIYGGTYTSDNPNAPAILLSGNTANVNLLGGKVLGGLKANAGTVTLGGAAQVNAAAGKNIYISKDAKLAVQADWTGTAGVQFSYVGENPIANGSCTGNYTGALTLEEDAGYRIVPQEGKLFVENYTIKPEQPIAPNFPTGATNGVTSEAWCEACQKNVIWTAASTGLSSRADGAHHHLFISGSRTEEDPLTWQLGTVNSKTTVCLYLNDTVTVHNGRLFVAGDSTVNIMGKGALLTNGTSTSAGALTGGVTVNAGTVNVLGNVRLGSLNAEVPAASVMFAAASINLKEGSVIEGGVLVSGGTLKLEGNVTADVIAVAKNGKLAVDQSYSGTAALVFEELYNPVVNSSCTGAFTGTLTTNIEGTDYNLIEKEGKLFIDGYQVVEPEEQPIAPNFPKDAAHGDTYYAYCQVCKKNVDWTCKSNGISTIQDGGHHHYFIAADKTLTWSMGTLNTGTTVCLHMNGAAWGGNSRLLVTGGSTINIFGGGKLLSTGTGSASMLTGTLTVFDGVANVYDVTVEGNSLIPALCTQYAQATVNLLEGSEVKGITNVTKGNLILDGSAKATDIQVTKDGKLTVKENWTGSAVANFVAALEENLVPAANGAAEGNFTGSLTTPEGGKITNLEGRLSVEAPQVQDPNALVLDANNMGYCQHCKTVVQWKAASTTGLSTMSDGAHHHLYMTADFTYTWGYVTLTSGTELCLHLNGFNIQQKSRIYLGNAQLNIMGNGHVATVVRNDNDSYNTGAITINNATVNIYGGTYDAPIAGIPAIYTQNASSVLNIYGGTVNGKADISKGNVTLGGAAMVSDLEVAKDAKLTVKADFAGMAAVNFAAALEENLVPAANGAAEGDFTGKLVTQSGEKISHKEGKLLVEAGKLALDANNMGYCQHCKAMVEWKAAGVTGLSTKNDGQHHHLYMTANFDQTWGYLTLTTNTKLCLHLNGFNIQQKGRILVSGAELNLMGKGTVASAVAHTNATYNTGAITVNNATVNIYGGTYESPLADIPAIRTQNAASRVNLLGGKVIGSAVIGKGILTLGGKAIAENLQVEAEGKLNVRADWAGTAKVAFAAALVEGKVPAVNGASEGAFTGTLTTGTTKLVGKDGLLEAEPAQ